MHLDLKSQATLHSGKNWAQRGRVCSARWLQSLDWRETRSPGSQSLAPSLSVMPCHSCRMFSLDSRQLLNTLGVNRATTLRRSLGKVVSEETWDCDEGVQFSGSFYHSPPVLVDTYLKQMLPQSISNVKMYFLSCKFRDTLCKILFNVIPLFFFFASAIKKNVSNHESLD